MRSYTTYCIHKVGENQIPVPVEEVQRVIDLHAENGWKLSQLTTGGAAPDRGGYAAQMWIYFVFEADESANQL